MLNWNGWRDTVQSLESLFDCDYENFSLVLLDNGSRDGSVDSIVSWCCTRGVSFGKTGSVSPLPANCRVFAESDEMVILHDEENDGFAGGNNIAISFALHRFTPEYIFLLNNDAKIEKSCLTKCVQTAISENATIVGALVKNAEGTSVLFSGADPVKELFWSKRAMSEDELPAIWRTGRVEASGELIRSDFLYERFKKQGYVFDPQLFMYGEDSDIALSAGAAGKVVLMTKSALIYHNAGGSSGGSGNALQYYYITRNRMLLANRWLPAPKKILFHLYFPVSRMVRIIQYLLKGRRRIASAIMEGTVDGYRGRTGKWRLHT